VLSRLAVIGYLLGGGGKPEVSFAFAAAEEGEDDEEGSDSDSSMSDTSEEEEEEGEGAMLISAQDQLKTNEDDDERKGSSSLLFPPNYSQYLRRSLAGSRLHDFSDDALYDDGSGSNNGEEDGKSSSSRSTWLLQQEFLSKRQPLTPRTAEKLERIITGSSSCGNKNKGKGKGGEKGGEKSDNNTKKKKEGRNSNYKSVSEFMDEKYPDWESSSESLLRMQQVREVNRIEKCFAQHSISIDRKLLERAILTPQDRAVEISLRNFPFSGMSLMENPCPESGGGGGKKKKKGGGLGW
jgi:hypothetical protein